MAETNTALTASGTLTVTDADIAYTVSSTVTAVTPTGTTAGLGLTNPQLLAMLSVPPAALPADPNDTHNLEWNFSFGTSLVSGVEAWSLLMSYTVTSTDNSTSPASDTQTVT